MFRTERTYVKGMQELVDIYIKPAATPVTTLSGVGQSKDSVVPAAMRSRAMHSDDASRVFEDRSGLYAKGQVRG